MNRRGFLGFLSKLVTVGAAIGVAPEILKPIEKKIEDWDTRWVQVGGPPLSEFADAPPGTCYAFKLEMNMDHPAIQKLMELEKASKEIRGYKLTFEKEKADITLAS